MLTYQIRPRKYKLPKGKYFKFPNDAELVFHFYPLQPFGKLAGGGRTAVKSVEAVVHLDFNTGRYCIKSKTPLKPLEVIIEEPIRLIEMRGNELHIKARFESLSKMDEIVQSLFFVFPILLNIEFGDPPFIKRVDGMVGDVPFRWELRKWQMPFDITTQENQEERIVWSWERLGILSDTKNRRVVAAFHYFHVACRLSRVGNSPWEFMSEIILNLSKVLEVLFPPLTEDGKTIDAAKVELKRLGYSDTEIDSNFTPAMAIRNHIDSAHVDISIFSQAQLAVLHAYTEKAEESFREMLKRLIAKTRSGEYCPVSYGEPSARQEAKRIIDRISKSF